MFVCVVVCLDLSLGEPAFAFENQLSPATHSLGSRLAVKTPQFTLPFNILVHDSIMIMSYRQECWNSMNSILQIE
jgi:hypothetical protein